MRHKFLNKFLVSTIAASTLLALMPIGASAAWINNGNGSWSYTEGYNYATGWKQIGQTWYFFDYNGIMKTGWISSGSEWYYADLSGAMQTGVIQIEGKIYLFSESGAMQKGVLIINKKMYTFDDNGVCVGSDYPMPAKAFDYYGNNTIPFVPNQIISDNETMSTEIPSDGKWHPAQYTVTFRDPDADDSDEEILKTKTVDEHTKVSLYKPTKSGYTFVEWNTESDGDGTSYENTDKVMINNDLTLYAQWNEIDTSADTDTDTSN